MGYTELQMAENANQPKGSLMLSGFFSKASSFHPVITQVLAKAQSWEMGLFMSCPPGLLSWANILLCVFEWPRKQGKEEILFLKRIGILRMEQESPDEGQKGSTVIADQETCSNKTSAQSRDSKVGPNL